MLGQSICANIKTGRFYFYPQNTKQFFVILRSDSLQREINVVTNDTSYWKINWKSPCVFDLIFLKTTKKLSTEELEFYKSNLISTQILEATKIIIFLKGIE
ncbi:hypothetical protein KRR40_45405 [Niabella defluvii]|nr:hypothetical protein KRR40_45405 [Niabella sp. I65]